MAIQERNDDLVNLLRSDFDGRYEPNNAWRSAVSAYLALPALRGFWPMSSVAYTNPQGLDESGNVLHLTNNNSGDFGYDNLIPYYDMDGVNQILSRPDGGAGGPFDVIGNESYIVSAQRGLTLGGWFNADNANTGSTQGLIAKFGAGGGTSRAYYLALSGAGFPSFFVSSDGTTVAASVTSSVAAADTTWFFTATRFVPSTTVDIWINSTQTSSAVGVPATLFDATSNFHIGSRSDTTEFYAGKASMCFLCAAQLSNAIIGALFQQTRAMFNV